MNLRPAQSISPPDCEAVAAGHLQDRARVQRERFDEQRIRATALRCFVDPTPPECQLLRRLTFHDWKKLLRWLDFSGLALYFFHRLTERSLQDLLPNPIYAQLEQNLADNTLRTKSMVEESLGIQREFQAARLRYANLKGFSLVPRSVPNSELRSQFDLDFLLANESAIRAREILEERGYRLYAVGPRSLEFKRNERPGFSLKDLYKDLDSWRVELHIESGEGRARSPLHALEWTELDGFPTPVLSSVDAFIGQGLHACKHLCGEFSRAAHLLEFRRHVISWDDNPTFWDAVYELGKEDRQICVRLGLVTMLIEQVMGEFAPEGLRQWTVRTLPEPVARWVTMYGHQAVLGSFPGSKLYLLLERALEEAGVPVKRRGRSALLPYRLPPPIILPSPQEPLSTRLWRYRAQMWFILGRLLFHIIEGLRYLCELHRWRVNRDRQPR